MENMTETVLFKTGIWNDTINVYDFVLNNIFPYEGDASFLVGPSKKTTHLWNVCKEALLEERSKNGCLAIDTEIISNITSFGPGYINKENEVTPLNDFQSSSEDRTWA